MVGLENCEKWCVEHLSNCGKCVISKSYSNLLVEFSKKHRDITFIFGILSSITEFSEVCFITTSDNVISLEMEEEYERAIESNMRVLDHIAGESIDFIPLTDVFKDSFLSWPSMFWVKDGEVYNVEVRGYGGIVCGMI